MPAGGDLGCQQIAQLPQIWWQAPFSPCEKRKSVLAAEYYWPNRRFTSAAIRLVTEPKKRL